MNSQVWINRHIEVCKVFVPFENLTNGENQKRNEKRNLGRNQKKSLVTNCLCDRFTFQQSSLYCGNMQALRSGGRSFGFRKKDSYLDCFGSFFGLGRKNDFFFDSFGKHHFSASNRDSTTIEYYSDSFGSFERKTRTNTLKTNMKKTNMTETNIAKTNKKERSKTKTEEDIHLPLADLSNQEEQNSLQTSLATSSQKPSQKPSETSFFYFEGMVPVGVGKLRLDSYIAEKMPRASRAKVQTCIKGGHVIVNGKLQTKVSYIVRAGEKVECRLPPPPPLEASPEAIPIEVVYEDENVLVVNKPPHLVVHPSPGHYTGTLVNALLYHCKLPSMEVISGNVLKNGSQNLLQNGLQREDEGNLWKEIGDDEDFENGSWERDDEGEEMEEFGESEEESEKISSKFLVPFTNMNGPQPIIRPGIVHRLDKGTSGLLVVAKDEYSHANLCDQFKARSVKRTYVSITCGVPNSIQERIETLIGRDPRDRKKMMASTSIRPIGHYRSAVSRYKVLHPLAGGGAALVEWKLETGRTHQIRVHAKHVGHPILGDETYGGMGKGILGKFLQSIPITNHGFAKHLMARLDRPCLHAKTLGFVHPYSGKELFFSADPPPDFTDIVSSLEKLTLNTSE